MQEQYWIPANFSWVLQALDFNFAVAEPVIVPNDTVTFPARETSTTTTIVVSFAEPVQLMLLSVLPFGVGQRFCVARSQ